MSICSVRKRFTDFIIRMLQITRDEKLIHSIISPASYFANAALTMRGLAILQAQVLAVLLDACRKLFPRYHTTCYKLFTLMNFTFYCKKNGIESDIEYLVICI